MTEQTCKRILIDPPSQAVILAARHLDATEGPVQANTIVDTSTRSAITTVLRYIATAHNAPPTAGEKDAPRRPCRYCPDPLCPEDCPECGSPIHDLDAVPAQHVTDQSEPGDDGPKCDCMMRSDHTLKCASGLSTGVRRVNRLGELIDCPGDTQLTALYDERDRLRVRLADMTRSCDEWQWRAEDAKRTTRVQRERAEQAETIRAVEINRLTAERDWLGREADRLRRDWVTMRDRAEQAEADLAEARATNQRLNYRTQQLESELAAYRRAVAQWEISERSTYVPLRTIAAIAKAAGRNIENPRWLLHYQRVEQAETAITRVRDLHARWLSAGAPPLGTSITRWWDKRLTELTAALAEPKEPTK
jgi:hypothetical protein